MATLFITEFSGMSSSFPAPEMPVIAEQHVQIGASSVLSSPLNAATTFIMLTCDAACCLTIGPSAPTPPVADGHTQLMPANTTRFYGVPRGHAYEVAVIAPL